MLNSKGSFQTWAVVKLGQLSPWGICLPGQLSYLGICPTRAVVLPGQLYTWAVVAWAVVLLGSWPSINGTPPKKFQIFFL